MCVCEPQQQQKTDPTRALNEQSCTECIRRISDLRLQSSTAYSATSLGEYYKIVPATRVWCVCQTCDARSYTNPSRQKQYVRSWNVSLCPPPRLRFLCLRFLCCVCVLSHLQLKVYLMGKIYTPEARAHGTGIRMYTFFCMLYVYIYPDDGSRGPVRFFCVLCATYILLGQNQLHKICLSLSV